MQYCKIFFSSLLLVLLLNSCKNDLEVLAPYTESASVYALLDAKAPIQFVKINKVFINPNTKATDIAKIADSLFFDTLKPYLIEEQTLRKIQLYRTNILLKDSGLFAQSPNNLYSTTEKLFPQYNYLLEIKLPKSGNTISAKTNMVDTCFITGPVNPSSAFPQTLEFIKNSSFSVRFTTSKNTKIFDYFFVFNYTEINKADTNIKTNKSIKWKLLDKYNVDNPNGGEVVFSYIESNLFYDMLLRNISANNNVLRRVNKCGIELYSGNEELYDYIQATEPSIGIVQKQYDYTNINGGIGIFAARNANFYNKITLGPKTIQTLTTELDLKPLNFIH